MDLGIGDGMSDGTHLRDIGHDKSVRPRRMGLPREFERGRELMLAQVDVARHVHAHAMGMRQAHRAGKFGRVDILCARARVEGTKTAVDGIGTCSNGRKQRIDRARGGQKLW